MKKTSKKAPNNKELLKDEIRKNIIESFKQCDINFDENYDDYGMTKGTLIVHGETCDLQIKFITPKSGIDRYEILADEEDW